MRRLLLLPLLLLLSVPVLAQVVTYESVTVGATAVGLANATLNPAGRPQIGRCSGRLETASIRFRADGTAPTATEGVLLDAGDVLTITSHADASAIQFIATTATSGVLKIQCSR